MNEFEILILAIKKMTAGTSTQKYVTFHSLLQVLEKANDIQEELARKEKEKAVISALEKI